MLTNSRWKYGKPFVIEHLRRKKYKLLGKIIICRAYIKKQTRTKTKCLTMILNLLFSKYYGIILYCFYNEKNYKGCEYFLICWCMLPNFPLYAYQYITVRHVHFLSSPEKRKQISGVRPKIKTVSYTAPSSDEMGGVSNDPQPSYPPVMLTLTANLTGLSFAQD